MKSGFRMISKLVCLMCSFAISKTAAQNMTAIPKCIKTGAPVTLICETTDFAMSVLFYLHGMIKGGCVSSSSCVTATLGYDKLTQSGTYTEMTINAYNHSRDGGDWTCSYGTATSDPYTVGYENCFAECIDTRTLILIFLCILLSLVIIQIVLLICTYYCHQKRTQKVRISLTTNQKLKSATYRINNNTDVHVMADEHHSNKYVYSCSARGGELLDFTYESDTAGRELQFKFMITDDLLYAIIDKDITLPSVCVASSDQISVTWSFNQILNDVVTDQGDKRIRKVLSAKDVPEHITVNKSNMGKYELEMVFERFYKSTLVIENMHVKAAGWKLFTYSRPIPYLGIVICFNCLLVTVFTLLRVLLEGHYSFCAEVVVVVLIAVCLWFLLSIAEVVLVLRFSLKRKGKKEIRQLNSLRSNGHDNEPVTTPVPARDIKLHVQPHME